MTDRTLNRLIYALLVLFLCTVIYGVETAQREGWPSFDSTEVSR